jgi:hypothetical protein
MLEEIGSEHPIKTIIGNVREIVGRSQFEVYLRRKVQRCIRIQVHPIFLRSVYIIDKFAITTCQIENGGFLRDFFLKELFAEDFPNALSLFETGVKKP